VRIVRSYFRFEPAIKIANLRIAHSQFDIAKLQVTIDGVFRDAIDDDLSTVDTHLVSDFCGRRAEALLYSFGFNESVNQLTAIAPGRSPGNAIRLEQSHVIASLGQMKHGGYAGKSPANDDHVDALFALQ
jgi:hypothetical protein